MLLTLTARTANARDLGYLLRKHPDKLQTFELPFGVAHVWYPIASDEECSAALFLEVDPVALVRGKSASAEGMVDAYVNDRPYVASSFLSVAIARVFGAALGGRSDRPDLAERVMDLHATIEPVRVDGEVADRLFEPLGYCVESLPVAVSESARSGDHRRIVLTAQTTLQQLLNHLYVLVPVLDGIKHYWVGDEEVEKLFRFGKDWLAIHPEREFITRRYLRRAPSLARAAVARLDALDDRARDETRTPAGENERTLERPLRLQERRIAEVVAQLQQIGAASIVDVGCGDGDLVTALAREPRVDRIAGVDVSVRELERARDRMEHLPISASRRERVSLFQSSALYYDRRLDGADAMTLLEVVEHVDPERLTALEKALFGTNKPRHIIVTTPNREYNARFPGLAAGTMRHLDHRFEWSRAEFQEWASGVASRHGFSVKFGPIGDIDERLGPPTQMAVFTCA